MAKNGGGDLPDELEVIASSKRRVVQVQGERLELKPLTVRQLPPFVRAVRPLIEVLNEVIEEGQFSAGRALELIETNSADLLAAVAAATGREPEWLADATLDEFTELVTGVFAVNLDFFVQRLLPMLTQNVDALAVQARALAGNGPIPSSTSSPPDTH